MPADFEFPIIETYTQLAMVVATLVSLVIASWWILRAIRRAMRPVSVRQRPDQPSYQPRPIDFDKLATLIAGASDHATSIGEKQVAATIKLDSTEMAVNRLTADLATVMVLPNTPKAAVRSRSGTLHASPARWLPTQQSDPAPPSAQ